MRSFSCCSEPCQAHIQLQILQRASAILLCPTSHHLLAHTLTRISLLVPMVGVVSFLLQVPCLGQGRRWSQCAYSSKLQGKPHSCLQTTRPQRAIQCLPIPGYRSQLLLPNSLARLVSACYWRGLWCRVYQLELGDGNYCDSILRYLFLQEQTKKPHFVIMMYLLWWNEPEGPSFVFIYAQEINSHEMKCQGCFLLHKGFDNFSGSWTHGKLMLRELIL